MAIPPPTGPRWGRTSLNRSATASAYARAATAQSRTGPPAAWRRYRTAWNPHSRLVHGWPRTVWERTSTRVTAMCSTIHRPAARCHQVSKSSIRRSAKAAASATAANTATGPGRAPDRMRPPGPLATPALARLIESSSPTPALSVIRTARATTGRLPAAKPGASRVARGPEAPRGRTGPARGTAPGDGSRRRAGSWIGHRGAPGSGAPPPAIPPARGSEGNTARRRRHPRPSPGDSPGSAPRRRPPDRARAPCRRPPPPRPDRRAPTLADPSSRHARAESGYRSRSPRSRSRACAASPRPIIPRAASKTSRSARKRRMSTLRGGAGPGVPPTYPRLLSASSCSGEASRVRRASSAAGSAPKRAASSPASPATKARPRGVAESSARSPGSAARSYTSSAPWWNQMRSPFRRERTGFTLKEVTG